MGQLRDGGSVRTYILIMNGLSALILLGLAWWLGVLAWRTPAGRFRAVTVGGAALCLLLGTTSIQHLVIEAATGPFAWRHTLLGSWEAIRATGSVMVGVWAVVLALRNWTRIGRAHSMVDVLTERMPSEATVREAGLSLREQEVLELIRQGTLADGEIARTLHISPATAATHVQNILRKTGLHNRRDLMLLPRSTPGQKQA
jgi:DNA-binding CsgD family transcriptional regulator